MECLSGSYNAELGKDVILDHVLGGTLMLWSARTGLGEDTPVKDDGGITILSLGLGLGDS